MKKLKGNVALVTGAGRGIGRACAVRLAEHGATVFVTSRTKAELHKLAAEIKDAGGKAVAVPGDLTQQAFVEKLFAQIEKECGGVDIVVNNAGIAPFGLAQDLDVARFRAGLELNVVAAFACSQQAIRLMKKNKAAGKIINIGSVRSHWTEGGDSGAYNASKYALRGMTESIARQLHREENNKIAVSIVSPGIVDTTLTNPSRSPQPTWLRAETIADAVLHAAAAPDNVNVYETIVFPTTQAPW